MSICDSGYAVQPAARVGRKVVVPPLRRVVSPLRKEIRPSRIRAVHSVSGPGSVALSPEALTNRREAS